MAIASPSPTPPIVAFTSGKGGCGKTTLAINFANVVAEGGHKVLLVDLDLSNRGSTGLFSTWTPKAHEKLTTLRLIRDELSFEDVCRDVLEVKPGKLFFLPAASPDEKEWREPDQPNLAEFVEMVRTRILSVAERCGIACIVLDCFCGIDLLTTAAAAIADDAILVNEPDMITFTGSINLLRHLFRKFEQLERKPRVHLVINRVRSDQTVPQLSRLYRGNIEKIIKEPIFCYFPYHPRVFENFGRYPFISDLLPRSLFVRKLKLLTYFLFNERSPSLVDRKVASWSQRKIRSVYTRTLDPSAIDTQYLVLKLTHFPVLLGLWAVLWLTVFRTFPVSPGVAWLLKLVLLPAAGLLFATTALYGFWLAARLNLSLTAFRFRLARLQQLRWDQMQWLGRSLGSLMAGLLMLIGAGWLTCLLGLGAMRFVEEMDFGNLVGGDKAEFKKNQILAILSSDFVREVDLRALRLEALQLFPHHGRFDSSDSMARTGFLDLGQPKRILTDGATFVRCTLYEGVFRPETRWKKCTFDDCTFFRSYASDLGSEIKIQITENIFQDTTFHNFGSGTPIFFRKSTLTGVTIDAAAGAKVGFVGCTFDNASPTHLKNASMEESRVFIDSPASPGFVNEGRIVQVPDETFQLPDDKAKAAARQSAETTVETLSERIARYEQLLTKALHDNDPDSRPPFADLAELYILKNDSDSFAKAATMLDKLDEEAKTTKDSSVGIALMLRLLKCIVSGESESAGAPGCDAEREKWYSWLEGHPAALRYRWIWNAWGKYSPTASYSDEQLAAIRAVQLEATGTSAEVSAYRPKGRPTVFPRQMKMQQGPSPSP